MRRAQRDVRTLVDTLGDVLVAIAADCNGDAAHDIARFLKLQKVFDKDLPRNAIFVAALEAAYAEIE